MPSNLPTTLPGLLDSIADRLFQHAPHKSYACQWCGCQEGDETNPLIMGVDALGRGIGICARCAMRAAGCAANAGVKPTGPTF